MFITKLKCKGKKNWDHCHNIKKYRNIEIKKFLETNNNGNTTQNLWDTAKERKISKFLYRTFYHHVSHKSSLSHTNLILKDFSKIDCSLGPI